MSKKSQDLFANFIKKQINEKAVKPEKTGVVNKKLLQKDNKNQEKLSDEEKLKTAKKESNAKAAIMQDKTAMFKRMFLEATMKYVLAISLLVAAIISLIKFIPMLGNFLHGLLARILIGGL